ncbi:apolipoprotein N-acyltransferase [Cryobacterium mannosilyticum]|uniref:Apolipoprotein N-acyltransferase n=1 Tax=Cryobacterium mannosilyticum TaxID=1259190 RepID=A0A4R8WC40_9MICO|nr:apolipoprotein N-acyltransferase [Cryobacterium mannosilyticum]TFC06823.1 apolipoprotein N-acyltransferase [Cryobacterium mannosilyticum]
MLDRDFQRRADHRPLTLASATGLPLWAAILLAAGAGAILDGAFPDRGWWVLAPVGVVLMLLALLGHGPGAGLLIGMVAGLSFWLVHISWLTLYLGPVPWLALATLQAIFFGASLALIGVVLRVGPRVWSGAPGRLGVVPVIVAGIWTAREALTAVWPYGGFAWGRVALSQSESPFGSLVAWVGMSGLSFIVVWLSALILQLLREYRLECALRLGIAVAAIAILLAMPALPTIQTGSTRLAAVQGASDAGLFARYAPGQILADHASATVPLGGEEVDFVVWPENSSDIDPTRSADAARVSDDISRAMNAPLVTGTITERDGKFYNSSLLWKAGQGAVGVYDKAHPVPFAEYLPDRAFWRPFAPELVDLVWRDYEIGTRGNVFDLNGILAGIAICFDIADDRLVREMIDGKAQIILAQTNNADFGRTDESVQQLAIARLRAIEAGRTVVNISTVGSSAIITPDGKTLDSLPTWEPGAMVQTVPLSDTVTPAMRVGSGIEWLVSGLGLAGLALCLLCALRRRSGTIHRPLRFQ